MFTYFDQCLYGLCSPVNSVPTKNSLSTRSNHLFANSRMNLKHLTKVFGFVGTVYLRIKIIINDKTLEQVSQFTYLVCSISYQFSNDV